jgi:amidase
MPAVSPGGDAVTIPIDTVGAFVGDPSKLVAGVPGGPLDGVRLAVKDMFDVVGTVTGAGNPTFAADRQPAAASAPAVQRLVAAGATVVGKTITDELAYSLSGTNVHYGTPRNVRAPGRVPGGSSAGSAAAVAAGLVELALGTDTGGSIRVPASYCGILGWRPTHGAVDTGGVVPLAPSFDTVGLLASDPSILLAGAEALLAPGDDVSRASPRASERWGSDVRPVRLAWLGEAMADVDPTVAEACRAGVAALGVDPATIDIGVDVAAAAMAFRARQGWEAWRSDGPWIRAVHPDMGPGITARFEAASQVTQDAVDRADVVRAAVRDAVARATADGTVLVQPAAAGAAPPVVVDGQGGRAALERRRSATLRLTCIAGLAGAPVVVRPLASDQAGGGFPLGVAFVGGPGTDRRLLRWCAEVHGRMTAEAS